MAFAIKPFQLDYSVELIDASLLITAFHNGQPVATDAFPFPITSRQPRPAECVQPVARLHLKAIHAVAAQHHCSPEALTPHCLIGTITLPGDTTA